MKLALVSICILLPACGVGRSDGSKDEVEGNPNCQNATLPDPPVAAGQIALKLPPDVDACNLTGYVVGYSSLLKVKPAQDGFVYIDNVPAGVHDVILVEPDTSDGTSNLTSSRRGVRLKKEAFLNGVRNEKSLDDLPPTASIKGFATLGGQTDHTGIDVFIPGTDYLAKTDKDGSYLISNVPSGEHNLVAERDGYYRGRLEELAVTPGSELSPPDLRLVLSTGASGYLSIEDGAEIFNSLKTRFVVGASDDAVLMRVSESDSFDNTPWSPLSTVGTYTFSSQGEKKLFIQFADANGLPSAVYSDSISIDLFSDGSSLFSPSFELESSTVSPNEGKFSLTDIKIPATAAEMLVSLSPDFEGATPVSPSSTFALSFERKYSSCGPVTINLKFRSKESGLDSPSFAVPAKISCWIPFSSDGAPSSRANHTAVWTGNSMIVWGGYGNACNPCANGGIYNPSTDSWTLIETNSPLGAIRNHSAVWTGSRMIVWGGVTAQDSGASYNPASNSWSAISTVNAPLPRWGHSAVWTGTRMLVWGGANTADQTVYSYDPTLDQWTSFSPGSAPAATFQHAGVWTGSEMYVFGGFNELSTYAFNPSGLGTWARLADPIIASNPSSAIFTGTHVIALSHDGSGGSRLFFYTPGANSWSEAACPDTPKRIFGSIVWDGSRVLFWGGQSTSGNFSEGYAFQPIE